MNLIKISDKEEIKKILKLYISKYYNEADEPDYNGFLRLKI